MKIFTDLAHVLQQLLFLAQELDGDGTGQRASAEGGSMHTRMKALATRSVVRIAPSGKPQARGLATVTMSGKHAVVLVGKVASGAAEAALNFVEHEQRAALFRQARRPVRETPG